MVFSDSSFIFFILPLFIVVDYLIRKLASLLTLSHVIENRIRNYFLILLSLIFCAWQDIENVKVLIIYGVLNYIFGQILYRTKERTCSNRKLSTINTEKKLLIIFISINLLALFYYKYLNWIATIIFEFLLLNFNSTSTAFIIDKIDLPLGISFFTFHAISYLIDIYREDTSPTKFPTNFLTYFFMFPHLIAGPIVRYNHVKLDIDYRIFDRQLFIYGISRFLLGLNKKILIANSVAPIADWAFSSDPASMTSYILWVGAIAYAVQIYFDFSAYSDMAIGLAAMAGFRFHENFNCPYKAESMKDFWRRWHISLSSWLKDYVYIPLGGSRCSPSRTYLNLIMVFFLCGLWHGANSTFVIWGLYNGLFLIVERIYLSKLLNILPMFVRRLYLLIIVLIGWVFFRADTLGYAKSYIENMLVFNFDGASFDIGILNLIALVAGALIALFSVQQFIPTSSEKAKVNSGIFALNLVLFLLSILIIFFGSRNPFIYFNF